MYHSLPGSSAHGILQARILEWVAIPFSRGSSQTRDRIWVSCLAGRFFPIWVTSEAHWASTTCQILLIHNICKTLLNLILLRRFWSDVYDHHFANKKKNKWGLQRLSHSANATQLATVGNVAIKSPGRFINKGMMRLDEAQRGYRREKMASQLWVPWPREQTQERTERFTV